jgi:hypothetical protein
VEDEGERKKAEWTYQGRRLDSKSKVVHLWVDGDGTRHIYGGSNLAASASIGGVFRITYTNDGASVMTSGPDAPVDVRMTENELDRLDWTLQERQLMTRLEGDRRAKREATDPLAELLAPLRTEYRSLVGNARRAALLASIIQAVTG